MANLTILEPMSTGDVIDRAVRLYRRNFTPLIAIVIAPSLIGYISSLMFWYGYATLLAEFGDTGRTSDTASAFLVLGGFGYFVWFFVLLFALCGLSRSVGDHIMLGDSITFRKCFSAAGKKFGDIFVMGLLLIGIVFVLYIFFLIVVFVAALIMGVIIGITASAQLPRWLASTVIVITVLVVLALGIFLLLLILSRIVFLPQAIMIEGQRVGNALGRAMRLGGKNWYKIGAIVLFIYFISVSLLAALTLPVVAGLYLFGLNPAEFFFTPTGSILYTSFSQLSNILVLPLWVVSYTLLYFDSRVRKEAYDLELLAIELSPGFHWMPAMHGPSVGYRPAPPPVQTSPLGLSSVGIAPPTTQAADDLRSKFDRAATNVGPGVEAQASSVSQQLPVDESAQRDCSQCGATIMPRARFCIRCGAAA
ncbi:MAG: zinc ribbon domain-containing protein [Acidobacteriota bacterium]